MAGTDLPGACAAALTAGLRRIQLREKDLNLRELTPLARRMRSLTAEARAQLLLNVAGDPERIALAEELALDGLHLPTRDLGRPEIRESALELRRRRPELLLAASTHGPAEVAEAAAAGMDFATIGPVFDTPSKRSLGHPIGLHGLAQAARGSPLPLYGLGGIGREQIPGVVRAGAVGVGCIRAVLAAADPGAAARILIDGVASARVASPHLPPDGETPEAP